MPEQAEKTGLVLYVTAFTIYEQSIFSEIFAYKVILLS